MRIALVLCCTLVVATGARPAVAAFPGPDGLIAFVSDRAPGRNWDIWTMRPDGSHLRNLTHNGFEEHCPSWSPDGRFIAFTRRHTYPEDLWVMRADGSGQRRVAHLESTETCPSWTPDGRRLVFVRSNVNMHDVFSIGLDGRGLRRITTLSEAWEVASVSRSGTVAYESTHDANGGCDIDAIGLDGAGRHKLTQATKEWYRHPNWSPDGRRIAYVGDLEDGKYSVHVMNADGSGATRITQHTAAGDDTSPAWSPDGKRIVFARFTSDGMTEIYTASAAGGDERRLTRSRFTEAEPDWGRAPR